MIQINNLQPEQILSFNQIDVVLQAQFNPSTASSMKVCIHSSLLALWKLTQKAIATTPCHKLLTFTLKAGGNNNKFDSIDIKQIKSLLAEAVKNVVSFKIEGEAQTSEKMADDELKTAFTLDIYNKILKQQYFMIMASALSILNQQFQLECAKNIQIAWKSNVCLEFYENNISIVKNCSSYKQLMSLVNLNCSETSEISHFQAKQTNQISQFKQLLSKLSGNSKIKLQLYKIFHSNSALLQRKEEQMQKWMKYSNEFEVTVREQMKWIELQQQEKQCLEESIQTLKQQLKLSQDRLKAIQSQTQKLECELAELKQPIISSNEVVQSYYINPFYEKSQMQEKMFMEMIEVESELLQGKDQIKIMTDSIIDVIKACHNSFEDLQASKFFLTSFNRNIFGILKDIKSLQAFDLQNILIMRQESLFDSEYLEDTRKSEISTFSEIQFDQKMSRFTEDDSLSILQGDQ